MLVYSIFELFTQAASSSGFIFCFCNLIIVIILMDLKPRVSFDEGSEITVSMARPRSQGKTHKAEENSKGIIDQKEEEGSERSQDQKQADEAGDNCSNEEDLEAEVEEEEMPEGEEVEEEDDDDELRKKVEEFIQKVNKAWRAEFLST